MLERLQESAGRSGYFLPAFFMYLYIYIVSKDREADRLSALSLFKTVLKPIYQVVRLGR